MTNNLQVYYKSNDLLEIQHVISRKYKLLLILYLTNMHFPSQNT